eukprot:scaffold6052_cov76-Isochrysis_galbana.AAC.1
MAAEGVSPDSDDTPPLHVSSSFGTVTEYFFLCMRVQHMGLLSSFTVYQQLAQQHHRWRNELQMREAEVARMRGMGGALPAAAGTMLETIEAETAKLRKSNDVRARLVPEHSLLSPPFSSPSCLPSFRTPPASPSFRTPPVCPLFEPLLPPPFSNPSCLPPFFSVYPLNPPAPAGREAVLVQPVVKRYLSKPPSAYVELTRSPNPSAGREALPSVLRGAAGRPEVALARHSVLPACGALAGSVRPSAARGAAVAGSGASALLGPA